MNGILTKILKFQLDYGLTDSELSFLCKVPPKTIFNLKNNKRVSEPEKDKVLEFLNENEEIFDDEL